MHCENYLKNFEKNPLDDSKINSLDEERQKAKGISLILPKSFIRETNCKVLDYLKM